MEIIPDFLEELLAQISALNFSLLTLVLFSAFAAVFLISLLFCAFSRRARACKKIPYYAAVKLFCALSLVIFLSKYSLSAAVALSALFWCVGALTYALLCLFKNKKEEGGNISQGAAFSSLPERRPVSRPPRKTYAFSTSRVQGEVRLDHALSISDKLLLKNLTRSDRQELEKIKTALTVLRVKESLSQEEGAALNDMFNALLKLMAKYDM